jgi:hypothetical protein
MQILLECNFYTREFALRIFNANKSDLEKYLIQIKVKKIMIFANY